MDPDFTIILLGNTGVGKSASGNTILGQSAFESKRSFKSVTKDISEERGDVFGKQISVIDTPGILCPGAEEQIVAYCHDVLQNNRPVLFLVVIKIDRFTKEQEYAVDAATRVLEGLRSLENSYLLFTGGDALEEPLESFIVDEDSSLTSVVQRFSGRIHLFNNEEGEQDQVKDLMQKSGHLRSTASGGEHPAPQDRRIVLLGRPGAGKSSSGNTILGSEIFTSDCDFVSGSARVGGRQVTVVDTPGLSDEALTPEQLYLEIMKTLVEANPGPHAFVIVVRLGRVSDADIRLFKILPKLFGGDASKYVTVLFTHGDQLKGQSIQDKIKPGTPVSDLVSMCGGRYCVFDNNKTGNRRQVSDLLTTIDEMVSANGGGPCSSDLFRMAETFIREDQQTETIIREDQQTETFIREDQQTAGKRLRYFLKRQWQKVRSLFTCCCQPQPSSSGSEDECLLEDVGTETKSNGARRRNRTNNATEDLENE